MGRYYNGDISGKFWFGVQRSDAADRFGVTGETSYIHYCFCPDDLPKVKAELKNIVHHLGGEKELKRIDDFFETHNGYNDEMLKKELGWDDMTLRYKLEEYADYCLGKEIEKCMEENEGFCSFECEL